MKTYGFLSGDIGVGWLLALFAVMTAAALGGASVGGWAGVAIVAAVLLAVVGLIILWAGAPPKDAGRNAEHASSEQGQPG